MSLEWNKIEVKDINNESDALIEMCDSFYFDKEGNRHTPYINGLPEFIEWDQVPILAQFLKKCNELYQRFQDANLMDLEYKCGHCGVICKKNEIININKEYAECIRCPNCKEYDNFELVFEDLVNSSAIVEAKEETLHKIKKRLFEAFPNAGWDQAPNNDILSYCINLGSYISQTPEFLEVKTKEGLLKIVQDQIRTHKKKILTKNNTFEEELRELRQAILDCNVSTIDEKWETITTMYEQASKSTLDTELDKESIPLKNNYIGGLEPIIDALDDFQLECLQEYIKNKNKKGDLELVEEHNKKIEQLENEAVRRLKKKLYFFSRHEPNNGQIAVAKELGFDEIERVELVFSTISAAPEEDIEKKGILEKTIAIVAPTFITARLLNKGYTIIEFVNSSIKRERNLFCCKGAYKYTLKHPIQGVDCQTCMAHIQIEYHDCPIPLEEQIESSLHPEKRGA